MQFNLNPIQSRFVFSKSKYPAMVGGWGTGKTLCGCIRAITYAEHIPNSLGMILRNQFVDLRDSTIKDFERYTGRKVDSQRNVVYENGSIIMFRCMDEFKTQNVNLNFGFIEQAEELESDDDFLTMFGRMRREVQPDDFFKSLGLPARSFWIIANAGDNWVKNLWKDEPAEGFELIESVTMDNKEHLPADFIDSLEVLRVKKPELYDRYVKNDWTVTSNKFSIINKRDLDDLKNVQLSIPRISRSVIASDPSLGGDECVNYCIKDGYIVDELILNIRDTMKICGELMLFGRKNNTDWYAVDTIGIGKGIGDRLSELNCHVNFINSAETAFNPLAYANRRAEMWGNAQKMILDRVIPYPHRWKLINGVYVKQDTDDRLIKQLTGVRYGLIESSGRFSVESKKIIKTKKRLGESPDRADAFVYGLWALKDIKPEDQLKVEPFRMSKRIVPKAYSGNSRGW